MYDFVRAFWERFRIRGFASRDAKLGLNQRDLRIRSMLGPPPPAFDPTRREDHRQLAALRAVDSRIADFTDDLTAQLRTAVNVIPWEVSAFMLTFLFVTEIAATQQLVSGVGLETALSWIFSLMFSAVIFVLAAAAVHDAGWRTGYVASLATYGLTIAAIAVIRFDQIDFGDEASPLVEAAVAFILLMLSVGPGLLAERVIRALWQGRRSAATIRQTKSSLTAAEHQHLDATAAILALESRQDEHRAKTEQLGVLYDARHAEVTARLRRKVERRAASTTAITPFNRKP